MSFPKAAAAAVAALVAAAGLQSVTAGPAAAASVRDAIVASAYAELNNDAHNHESELAGCDFYSGYYTKKTGPGCPAGWNNVEWCAYFVHYTWDRSAGVAHTGELDGWAQSFKDYGVRHQTWHPTGSGYAPRPGDAAVYKNLNGDDAGRADHVGLVVSYSDGVLFTIDGNAGSNAQVKKIRASSADIQGYTSPVITDVIGSPDSVGMYRGSTARFYLDYDYDGVSEKQVGYGTSGDMPVSGDWNGDGSHGLGLFRPSAGTFFLDENNDGTTDKRVPYGGGGDRPVAADWDGVSGDGIGVFRVAEGRFYLDENSDGTTDRWISYGTNGDWPVAGNWDGIASDGIGVFRPSEGRFYLDDNNDGRTEHWVDYGTGGDLPLAGDWNGDGADGIGVFRPSTGMVYLDDDLDGVTDVRFAYGTSGDRPLSRTIG